MTTLAWPTLDRSVASTHRWRLLWNTQKAMASPFSSSVQTSEQAGARWAVAFAMENLEEADWRILEAWFAELRGMAGRFTLHDMAAPNPRGTITTSGVTLNGALAQGISTGVFAGCGNAKTLLRGDKFAVAGELKIVVNADKISDGAGAMTAIRFEPPVRAAAGWADGAAVTLASPTATFMLTADSYDRVTRPGIEGDLALDAIEVY